MTEYETYQEHIRYAHNAYCRIVIRHASFSAARMLATRWKREISFEYLTEEKFVPFSITDEYFSVPDYEEPCLFSVRGQTVLLDNCALATALTRLPKQTQEEIFLYYFQHMTQKKSGNKTAGHAVQSDGAIVGSAIVKICAKYGKDCVPHVKEYVCSMKAAVQSAN